MRFISHLESLVDMAKHPPDDGSHDIEIEAIRSVAHIARVAKWVGRSLVVVDLGFIGADTYEIYRHGGDWQRELVEELAGFGGDALGIKLVIGTVEGPPGWVVVIGAMGANIVMGSAFKWIANEMMSM